MPESHEVTDDERIDEAMAESFPASDSPSWTAGLSHEPAHPSTVPLSAKFAWMGNWNEAERKLKQKFGNLTEKDLLYEEGDEEDLLVRLQIKLGMTRQEIEVVLAE